MNGGCSFGGFVWVFTQVVLFIGVMALLIAFAVNSPKLYKGWQARYRSQRAKEALFHYLAQYDIYANIGHRGYISVLIYTFFNTNSIKEKRDWLTIQQGYFELDDKYAWKYDREYVGFLKKRIEAGIPEE